MRASASTGNSDAPEEWKKDRALDERAGSGYTKFL